jgi:sterol desaturase/sphingolipid hydroxylase (fatty acid hydroxylase superfamily)
VLSLGIKLAIIALVGAPALAVVIFEIVLNGTSMFNHANIAIPRRLDRVLRWLVATPDMHRVHHSIHRDETDSNFGFNLPWWAWLFRCSRSVAEVR